MNFLQNRKVCFNQKRLKITCHNFRHKSLVRLKSKSQNWQGPQPKKIGLTSHGNIGFIKFYLKPYPYYINFWNTETLFCKLWSKYRQKIGIFSLVPRVIPPVTSQLITVYKLKWSNLLEKMGWINSSQALRLLVI